METDVCEIFTLLIEVTVNCLINNNNKKKRFISTSRIEYFNKKLAMK